MRNLLLATAAVGALALATPAAHATLIINAQGGAGVVNIVNVAGDIGSGNTTLANGVVVVVTGSSNAPGAGGVAELFSSTTEISNPTTATQTVTLYFAQNGFTIPGIPPDAILTNNASGTWTNNGGTSTAGALGCVDPSNSATTTDITCPAGSTSTAVQSGSVSADNGSFNAIPSSILVTTAVTTYALGENIQISIAPGGNFNLTNSESLRNVPEPASLALLGVGLLGVGFIARRKRSV